MTRARREGASLLLLVPILAAAGCAFGEATVRAPQPQEVATGSHRGEGREILVVQPFVNRRGQGRCGMKKNGYNMDTANVVCAGEPEQTIAYLVAHELWAAGFKVLTDPSKASPSTIVLSGWLDQTFLEPKLNFFDATFETDVALVLTAKTATGLSAERRFFVKGEEATYFASEADMQRSFDSGVRQLVTAVVGAVANLADRYPAPPANAPASVVTP